VSKRRLTNSLDLSLRLNPSRTKAYATEKGDLELTRSPFLFRVFRAHDRKRSVALLKQQAGETLRLGHFFGLWTFRALRHFKLDFLALFEGLEAISLNGAVVNEDVRGARLFNEAIALRVVKPLDLTGYSRHTNESS